MDKAQAYAVLRIEPGCTQEEIKEAYAALSRQYHPEEYPEERAETDLFYPESIDRNGNAAETTILQ